MATFDERMAAIMWSDAQRRMERDGITVADILGVQNALYYEHRDITGTPRDSNRTHRASQDCWEAGIRRARALNSENAQRERNARTTNQHRHGLTVDQINAQDARAGRTVHTSTVQGNQSEVD